MDYLKSKFLRTMMSLSSFFNSISLMFSIEAMAEENRDYLSFQDLIESEDPIYSDDSSDFVNLSDVVPDIILELRYYSTYNFIGERIDGYEEPIALITKEAAEALKEVSDELVAEGYRLKVYDTYRPQMAAEHFIRWSQNDDTKMKEYFYPDLEKCDMMAEGLITALSSHTRGSTVDLTIFDMKTEEVVDMGDTFDFFGVQSHSDYRGVTYQQYANRMLLQDVMEKHGFQAQADEWWHFTLKDEPFPNTYFTFPINSDALS